MYVHRTQTGCSVGETHEMLPLSLLLLTTTTSTSVVTVSSRTWLLFPLSREVIISASVQRYAASQLSDAGPLRR